MEDFTLDVLGWGCLDAKKLKEYLDTAKVYDISIEDIREYIVDMDSDVIDINAWFYATLVLIYGEFTRQLEDYAEQKYPRINFQYDITRKLEDAREEFSPFINYLDSWFDNELDEYHLTNKEESFKAYLKVLINK